MIPKVELERRVTGFQAILREYEVQGALLVNRVDTLYLSGTSQNVHVYLPCEGKPLILAYRDYERAKQESPFTVIPLKGITKIPNLIIEAGLALPKVIGLEFDILPVAQYERYRKAFQGGDLVDISYPLRLFRAVKSKWEINAIEETGEIYQKLFSYIPTVLRPGMTEVEIDGILEAKARMYGHETLVRLRGFGSEFHFGEVLAGDRAAAAGYFDGPIVGQGVSYANPFGASHTPIQSGEPIIVDLALMKFGYMIDITRVFVIGELSEEYRLAYETSLELEEKIRKALVPGRVAGEIYAEIISWVNKETPYSENFMGYGPSRVGFVGHGIGLELDELPTISKGAKEVLKPGMTIAIEPKFIFPGRGAIGIEDTFVVEGGDGARCLSPVSREIIIV